MGGFSVGLLTAGLVAPYVGRSIDRFGGHIIMTIGSLIGALGLFLIVHAAQSVAYYAAWMVLGVAMAANLYDSAFATLGRIFGIGARRPITALTLAGGFASTVSWPATHFCSRVSAGEALISSMPRCWLASLRRCMRWHCRAPVSNPMCPHGARRKRRSRYCHLMDCRSFWWRRRLLATPSFPRACRPSAGDLCACRHRRGDGGLDWRLVRAGASGRSSYRIRVWSQFASAVGGAFRAYNAAVRVRDAGIAWRVDGDSGDICADVRRRQRPGHHYPRRGATGAIRRLGLRAPDGRLAGPFLLVQSAAPLVMAFVVEQTSDPAALALAAGFAFVALICFVSIRRPA